MRPQFLPRMRHRARSPPAVRIVPGQTVRRKDRARDRPAPPAAGRHGIGRPAASLDRLLWRGRGHDPAHLAHGANFVAEQVGGAGAIAVLEEGIHLLRRTPLSTLVCHWVGIVPLALAGLRYWSDIGNPRTSDAQCAIEAAGLAVLLVW